MMYRINYGNGQVSCKFFSKEQAKKHLEMEKEDKYYSYFFLQCFDGFQWCKVCS